MSTWSVRCRVGTCRHRRVITRNPDSYVRPPACPICGGTAGWRVEGRAYNKRGLCSCNGPVGRDGTYPHRTTHPACEHHPSGGRHGHDPEALPAGEPCTTDEAPF